MVIISLSTTASFRQPARFV